MNRLRASALWAAAATALAGCVTTTPPTAVHQPMTIRPETRTGSLYNNGAIYNVASARPLFEDRRARFIGDTITINITEKTQASKKSDTKAERTHSVDATIPTLVGVPFKGTQGLTVSADNSNIFAGKGENSSTNDFVSTITVTVIEVFPNGNLLVSGEKQVAIGHGQEYIRLSGIVNPYFVNAANTIPSSQIADARIEYKESGAISEAQVMGWLARFFLTVLPF